MNQQPQLNRMERPSKLALAGIIAAATALAAGFALELRKSKTEPQPETIIEVTPPSPKPIPRPTIEEITASLAEERTKAIELIKKVQQIIDGHTCTEEIKQAEIDVQTTRLEEASRQYYSIRREPEYYYAEYTSAAEVIARLTTNHDLNDDNTIDIDDATQTALNWQAHFMNASTQYFDIETDIPKRFYYNIGITDWYDLKARLDACTPDEESKLPDENIATTLKQLKQADLNNDGQLSIFENGLTVRAKMLTALDKQLRLDPSGTSFVIGADQPSFGLTDLNIASILHSNGLETESDIGWATSALYSLDVTTDGKVNTYDDITYDGLVDRADAKAIRALNEYFEAKYGREFSIQKITTAEMIFAYMDLAGLMMADRFGLDRTQIRVGYGNPQAAGFQPVNQRISLSKKSYERTLYKTITSHRYVPGKTHYAPRFSGLGGVAGFALGSLLGLGPVGSALMGGVGSYKSQPVSRTPAHYATTTEKVPAGTEIKTVEHFLARTENNEEVRVIAIRTSGNHEIYLFDTSKVIEKEELVRIIKEYSNGTLKHESTATETLFEQEVASQETSGRMAVLDLRTGRAAIFQERNDGTINYKAIYDILDHGHPEHMGGSKTENLAKEHQQVLEAFLAIPELAKLRTIKVAIETTFDPQEALERESKTLPKVQELL